MPVFKELTHRMMSVWRTMVQGEGNEQRVSSPNAAVGEDLRILPEARRWLSPGKGGWGRGEGWD